MKMHLRPPTAEDVEKHIESQFISMAMRAARYEDLFSVISAYGRRFELSLRHDAPEGWTINSTRQSASFGTYPTLAMAVDEMLKLILKRVKDYTDDRHTG